MYRTPEIWHNAYSVTCLLPRIPVGKYQFLAYLCIWHRNNKPWGTDTAIQVTQTVRMHLGKRNIQDTMVQSLSTKNIFLKFEKSQPIFPKYMSFDCFGRKKQVDKWHSHLAKGKSIDEARKTGHLPPFSNIFAKFRTLGFSWNRKTKVLKQKGEIIFWRTS